MAPIFLPQCLASWGTDRFRETLAQALAQLPADQLPLQQALAHSSRVSDDPITVLFRGVDDDKRQLRVRVTVLFSGVVAGCNCADDPSLEEQINEHCELQVEIDKITAETVIRLAD